MTGPSHMPPGGRRPIDAEFLESLTIEVRILTRRAIAAGAEVIVEVDRYGKEVVSWIGTESQLLATGGFRPSAPFTSFRRTRFVCGVGGTVGRVWHEPDGRIRHVMSFYCEKYSLAMRKSARADRDFQGFMERLISDRSLGLVAAERE